MNILVSGCLLGINCRYDGTGTLYEELKDKMGDYNPKELSDGYKVAFLNYGTPRISPREFISAAKKKAKPQIKKAQEEVLNKVLARLKK